MEESLKIPHFGYSDEFRMDNLIKIRNEYSSKVSMMAFIIKAISTAVKDFPTVNAHYKSDKLWCSSAINLGIAVDTPQRLVVPVLKNVEKCQKCQKYPRNFQNWLIVLVETNWTRKISKVPHWQFQTLEQLVELTPVRRLSHLKFVLWPLAKLGQKRVLLKLELLNRTKWPVSPGQLIIVALDGATMARFSNHVKELIEQQ